MEFRKRVDRRLAGLYLQQRVWQLVQAGSTLEDAAKLVAQDSGYVKENFYDNSPLCEGYRCRDTINCRPLGCYCHCPMSSHMVQGQLFNDVDPENHCRSLDPENSPTLFDKWNQTKSSEHLDRLIQITDEEVDKEEGFYKRTLEALVDTLKLSDINNFLGFAKSKPSERDLTSGFLKVICTQEIIRRLESVNKDVPLMSPLGVRDSTTPIIYMFKSVYKGDSVTTLRLLKDMKRGHDVESFLFRGKHMTLFGEDESKWP